MGGGGREDTLYQPAFVQLHKIYHNIRHIHVKIPLQSKSISKYSCMDGK